MNTQQLRAQIVALQDATFDENNNFRTAYDEGKFDALTAVINLLDSMQEVPVSEGLEIKGKLNTRAGKFIQDYTRTCSNDLEYGGYHEWLTPDQARRAVEIAREEVIEKAIEYIKRDGRDMLVYDINQYGGSNFNIDKTIERFKQEMKDE